MNRRACVAVSCLTVLGIVAVAGTLALAQPGKDGKGAPGKGEMPQLPPGMSMEDMQACALAGTPGKMHAEMLKGVGVWQGKQTMWFAPGTEPMHSECTSTISSFMDGRFVKCEIAGNMMGQAYNGFGISGFDNVSQKFQSTWVDNHGTGIMMGTGDLSADGKTMTINYTYNCPITKKPAVMREVQKHTGADTMVMEMYGPDKTGKEFKMMEIAFTRKGGEAKPSVK